MAVSQSKAFDRDQFHRAVRERLQGLPRKAVVSFAARCAWRVMPFLALEGGRWAWGESRETCETHLLAVAAAACAAASCGSSDQRSRQGIDTPTTTARSYADAAANVTRSYAYADDARSYAAHTAAAHAAAAAAHAAARSYVHDTDAAASDAYATNAAVAAYAAAAAYGTDIAEAACGS
jgi:hypothetical protein